MGMARQAPAPSVDAFDAVAEVYDGHFTHSLIGEAQRSSVWREMDRHFHPGQRILELNCGTGVDALHLASRGLRVVACDASPGMIAVARRNTAAWRHLIDLRCLTTEQAGELEAEGRFDGVLSDFAGLNCVKDMKGVARTLARIVNPGGRAVLCLFGRTCLWEIAWYLVRGKGRKAFRRLSHNGVEVALAPGHSVYVRYPSVRKLRQDFAPHFHLLGWRGIGIGVPPSYLEPLALLFPRLLRSAAWFDLHFSHYRGLRALADHMVLVFERSNL